MQLKYTISNGILHTCKNSIVVIGLPHDVHMVVT